MHEQIFFAMNRPRTPEAGVIGCSTARRVRRRQAPYRQQVRYEMSWPPVPISGAV
jgi:hypothetical protein